MCEYGNVCGGQSTTSRTWFSPSIVVLRTHLGPSVYTVSVCRPTEPPLWLAPFLIIVIIQVAVP